MSDPLWFFGNEEESGSKIEQHSTPEKERVEQISDSNQWSLEDSKSSSSGFSKQPNNQEISESINWNAVDTSVGVFDKEDSQDENTLRSELGNSLLDFEKEKDKPTQFKIIINSNDIQESSEGEKTIAVDSHSGGQGFAVEHDGGNDKSSKILLTLISKENEQALGGDKTVQTDNLLETDVNVGEVNKEKTHRPTIYVILKSNKNENPSGDKEFELNNPTSNNQYYSEVGSAVIDLNDFISSESKKISANNDISITQAGSSEDGKSKVELVITIKDKRKKPSHADQTSKSYGYSEEENYLQEYPKPLIREESLDSQLRRIRGRIQNISNDLNSTIQGTKYNQSADNRSSQWSNETRDSFVRESDGARCYRTVWTTPGGRKVQTQCYKEDRASHQKRAYSRGRNYDWSPDFGSLWRDVNDDFNRLFTRANRFMYF